MTSNKIGLEYKYDFTSPAFKTAFEFLHRTDLVALLEGWINLENGVRASVQRYISFNWEDNRFETHEKYFDVQYVIFGEETCGVCSRDGLSEVTAYDENCDITFYEDPEKYSVVLLNAGDYIVLGPEDAHKPRCKSKENMPIGKIVVKVPVEL